MKVDIKNKFWEMYETVGQHFFDLMFNLLAMVVVARSFDLSGFGVFSYLVAVFHIASFLSEAGISDRFRNRYVHETHKEESLRDATAALFCTGTVTVLFFLITAVYDTSHTQIDEHFIAYFLIGCAVVLRNGNRLRTILLHVTGEHRFASRLLVKKHAVYLAVIWGVSLLHLPSLLAAAFLVSEMYHRLVLRNNVAMGRFFQTSFFSRAFNTIRLSLSHMFSGEALNLIFHADIFILGIFLASSQLGIYAEAALLGRFFLLIPVGIRPVLHRHYATLAAKHDALGFSKSVHSIRAHMFYIHSLIALILTIFFDDIIHVMLGFYGSEMLSYKLFTIMLPGLLFYAAIIVNESALEASGNAPVLSRLSAVILCLNISLNLYLIPFAGATGAAWATVICLLVHFCVLCSTKITVFSRVPIFEFIAAGAVVYLLDRLVGLLDLSLFLFVVGVAPVLYLCFYLMRFFDFEECPEPVEPKALE